MSDKQATVKEVEEEGGKWRKSEITAALVHLYYMSGENFDTAHLPRTMIAKMLDSNRFTIYRCVMDAMTGMDLAVEMKKRLAVYFREKQQRDAERAVRQRVAKDRKNARVRDRRRREKEQKLRDKRTREGRGVYHTSGL